MNSFCDPSVAVAITLALYVLPGDTWIELKYWSVVKGPLVTFKVSLCRFPGQNEKSMTSTKFSATQAECTKVLV